MSVARFGPDSDVYVYAEADGPWIVHVAEARIVAHPDYPVPTLPEPSNSDFAVLLMEHYAAREHCSQVPLLSEHAGENFQCNTARECADTLRRLAAAGVLVPAAALEDLDAAARAAGSDCPTPRR